MLLKGQAERIDTLTQAFESNRGFSLAHPIDQTSPQTHSSVPMTNLPSTSDMTFTPWPFGSFEGRPEMPDLPPLTIPVKHKTSSSFLLSLPAMKRLIGDYPPDLFFLLESRNPLPPELSFERWPSHQPRISPKPEECEQLMSMFLSTAHENHPILDENDLRSVYACFQQTGPDSSLESAICMIVFALGTIASSNPDPRCMHADPPGMRFMQSAMPTLIAHSSWSFSSSILLPQALVLASVYFAYIVRPLQSWRLIYSASTILQFKLSG